MGKNTTLQELLQDPTLSFSDFCFITNALAKGISEENILALPELAHLCFTVDPTAEEEPAQPPSKL